MERGAIQRSDPISKYFESVPEDKRAITLDHLMTGGSGLPDFHDVPADRDPDHGWVDRPEAVRRILGAELLFAPGEGRRHSHSAWGLLAAVIEIASEQSYQDFTQKNLFEPAGMVDTGFFGRPLPEERLAIGYGDRSDGEINAPPYWGPTSWLVMGSGGMVSTTGDLFRWNRALRTGVVLAPSSVEAYWSGEGVCQAGNMYGFEIAYTEGGSRGQMIVVTNAAKRGPRAIEPLARDLAGLVRDAGAPLAESSTFPASVQGQRAKAFVDAFNSEQIDRYLAFGHEHRVAVEDLDRVDAARAQQRRAWLAWGQLDVARVVTRPRRLDVLARGGDGQWRRFQFGFEAEAPHLIELLRIDLGAQPPGAAGHLDPDSPWKDLDELLEQAREVGGIPAIAAAVVRDGKIVASSAVGVRRLGAPDRVQRSDRFHWGSVGKSVTGTVIGRLMQEGVLEPTLTIGEVFVDIEVHEAYRQVTIEQLMCHRGGVPPQTTGSKVFEQQDGDPVALRATLAAEIVKQPPTGQVGVMRYSNAGIALAAHMAERRAGRSWEALVREHVFDAAGMKTAGHGWPSSVGEDQPRGHSERDGELELVDEAALPFAASLAPAGNVHSSIEDFARYALMHLDGLAGRDGHLEAATIRRLHQPLPGPGEPYAFGWAITTFPGTDEECHWHNGSGGTFFADIKLVPASGLGIVVLMNGYRPGSDLADEIGEALWRRYGE